MKKTTFLFNHRLAFLMALLASMTFGCGKKTSPSADATVPAEAPQTASPTASNVQAPSQPAVTASAASDNIAAAQAAMQAKDYDKAVSVLYVAPQTMGTMTGDQLADYNRTKNSLAQQLIAAAAAGDPAAKAAIEKIRSHP